MALKIIKESDPVCVTQIVVALHGIPGGGKSSLAQTAEAPCTLDFDTGIHRAMNRKDSFQFDCWQDVESLDRAFFDGYKTIVVDTAGRALEMIEAAIVAEDPRNGKVGKLSQSGFGVMAGIFCGWLRTLKSYKKDIILVCHSKDDQKGESLRENLDVVGKSNSEIKKACDVIGRVIVSGGKRTLNCSPDELAVAKAPHGIGKTEIPDATSDPKFMAKFIQQVKDAINAETEAQKPAIEFMEKWKTRIEEALTVDDYNAIRTELVSVECADQVRKMLGKMLTDQGKEAGISYDAKAKKYAKV